MLREAHNGRADIWSGLLGKYIVMSLTAVAKQILQIAKLSEDLKMLDEDYKLHQNLPWIPCHLYGHTRELYSYSSL